MNADDQYPPEVLMLAAEHGKEPAEMSFVLHFLKTPQRVSEYAVALRNAAPCARGAIARRYLDEARAS